MTTVLARGWTAIAALLVAAPTATMAAETDAWQTIAVVAFPSVATLQSDVEFLGGTIDNPNLAPAIARKLAKWSACKELQGFDPERPWGAVLQTDGLAAVPYLILPIIDQRQFLESLTPLIGKFEEIDGDTAKLGRRTLTGYLRCRDGWGYLAQSLADLDRLPDPRELFEAVPAGAEGGAAVHVQRLPQGMRTMVIDTLRTRRAELAAATADPTAIRLDALVEQRWRALPADSLERWLTDGVNLNASWSLDRSTRRFRWDLELTTLAGSRLSAEWAGLLPAAAPIGASPDAMLTALFLTRPSATLKGAGADAGSEKQDEKPDEKLDGEIAIFADVAGLLDSDNVSLQAGERAVLHDLAAGLSDQARALCNGFNGAGCQVALGRDRKRGPYRLLVALPVSDGDRLAKTIESLPQSAGPFVRIHIGAGRLQDLAVHRIDLPGLTAEHPLARLCGKVTGFYLASARGCVWLAAGPESLPWLLQALADGPREGAAHEQDAPFRVSLRMAALVRFFTERSTGARALLLNAIAANLSAGDDRLTIEAECFPAEESQYELRARMEAGDGILRAAATALALLVVDELSEENR